MLLIRHIKLIIMVMLLLSASSLLFAQPVNNLCNNATNLPCGTSNLTGTTVNTTNLSHGTGCTISNYGVWYNFTGNGQQTTITVNPNSGYDIEMAVTSGNCGSLNNITCVDGAGTGGTETYTFTTTNGLSYYIYLAYWSSGGGSSNTSGFDISRTCTPPPPPSPQDCNGGTTVCNSQSFSGNSSGSGTTQELNGTNSGCLSIEHQSSWYFFEASAAGQVAFTISPANGTDDYDFAVWGPYPTGSTPSSICPPTVAPLRCSYAAGGGNTGLLNGSGDNTEGAGGNRFVEDINVNVGDVFILVVDNFSTSLSPFNLNWNLTGGASLDCTPLPVILTDFYGNTESGFNSLHWVTENEVNNNFFRIQRSENGIDFYDIGTVSGAGNSTTTLEYSFNDYEVNNDYYYRLKQVDFNGKYELSNSIFIKKRSLNNVNIFPNPSTENLFISLNNSTNDEFIWIKYTSIIGKEEYKELVPIQDGAKSYKLNSFTKLNSGIYFIQVIRENKEIIESTKIIKK